jgi:uncharacterized protein (TIGR03086 family)
MSSGRPGRYTGMDIVDFGPAAQRVADLVASVKDEDLGKPTPCPAYTLGDLIDHVGGLALAFTGAATKDTTRYGDGAPAGDAARLTDDWRTRIPRDLAALASAWRKPDAWTGMTRIGGMDTPAEVTALVLADELAVHGWDVARATGQPYSCDPAVLAAARNFLAMFASPDAPAGPEVAFGPSLEAGPEASPLDQVVALAGRDMHWSAGTA